AQLAAVLLELQDDVVAASRCGDTSGAAAAARKYGSCLSACCSLVLQLTMALGGVECYGAAFGADASAAVTDWLEEEGAFWAAVTSCAGHVVGPGREQLGLQAAATALAAQAPALDAVGLDAVGALLAVALTPESGSCVLQSVAYRLLLLEPSMLNQVTLAGAVGLTEAATGSGGVGGEEVDLPEYVGDDVAYLVAGGVRPEMATWLLPPEASSSDSGNGGSNIHVGRARVHLTAWALLLAHALELERGTRALAVLRQLLREAGHLVHSLLGRLLLPELGLQKRQRQQQRLAAGATGGGVGGAASWAPGSGAVVPAGADGWRLAETLWEVGSPLAHQHAVRATCRALYRAVLRALPATARGWFSDLRDRGLAAAVEGYTAAAEGPALLAAELESVQALSRRAAAGGDGDFSVRASAASREVVAVMKVEDGAVLELAMRLPACLPLRAPEVECRRKVGQQFWGAVQTTLRWV
ncbi:hypothetical protein Agub_g4129, partial [Astrephomene gubernaculifera]